MTQPEPPRKSWPSSLAIRLTVLAIIVAGVGGLTYTFGGTLTLDSLAAREAQLRELFKAHPVAMLSVAFLLYAAITGLSIPGAAPMSLVYGWLFGFWTAVVLVSFASTSGASIAFLMSRYLIGGWVQGRFGEKLAAFNRVMDKEGAFYLFTLRLIPQVPFFVINVVMGLTKIRLTTFWWVSQLGMLPATCILVWAGASIDRLVDIQEKGLKGLMSLNVVLALAALGLFPLAVKWLLKLWQSKAAAAAKDV